MTQELEKWRAMMEPFSTTSPANPNAEHPAGDPYKCGATCTGPHGPNITGQRWMDDLDPWSR